MSASPACAGREPKPARRPTRHRPPAFLLEVAATCPAVDLDALTGALDTGAARRSLMDQAEHAATDAVRGSPHLFLPDGTDVHNPGVELRWNGRKGIGFPVVDRDDPSVYLDLVRRSVAAAA